MPDDATDPDRSAIPYEAVDAVLDRVERERAVTVVLAVAHGSHAWGVPGPDSDYDVRTVVAPDDRRVYAHLRDRETAFRVDADPSIDLEAWDARKFASLLRESNDGAIDLLRSPIAYRERVDRDALARYVLAGEVPAFVRERAPDHGLDDATLDAHGPLWDPMALYHTWRSIARSNYRKYLSHHLVDGDDRTYPVLATDADGYVVETPGGGERRVARDDERFTETAVRATVKRNLVVCRAAMSARYLRATGEAGGHELPAIDVPAFLDEQAPDVFDADRIATARELVDLKRAGHGDREVGDRVGRAFAHPAAEIDPAIHARGRPDAALLDVVVDELLDAAGGRESGPAGR
jgi:hypothetical protein